MGRWLIRRKGRLEGGGEARVLKMRVGEWGVDASGQVHGSMLSFIVLAT